MAQSQISRIAVIGAGAWGTTLAQLLAEKGLPVSLWVREEEAFRQIREERMNRMFLPDVQLHPGVHPVTSFEEAVSGKQLLLMVVPSHVYREVLAGIHPHLGSETSILTATKGIENETLMTMSQVTEELLLEGGHDRVCCLGGPSFAREVCLKRPTAVTVACRELERGRELQHLLSTEAFRVYLTEDTVGVELGGALKNVIALAAGIADGLEVGYNARAALITRGLAEITRLGVAMGASPSTFAGLAGMGDLVLTCTGDLSRNRTVGLEIGRGRRLEEILAGMNTVAEGVKTTLSAYRLSLKMAVVMPIVEQVYRVLYESKDPKEAVRDLMGRELRLEPEY